MLIVVMITVIGGFQLLVGERKLRRENRVAGFGDTRPVPLGQEKTA
jgi:iron(III) transport system permease protein